MLLQWCYDDTATGIPGREDMSARSELIMSKAVNLSLGDDQYARLESAARALRRPPAEAAVLLLEEALRAREFGAIEFRDSAHGRQAFLKGTRLAAWHVAVAAEDLGNEPGRLAAHFGIAEDDARVLLQYAAAHPAEVRRAIDANDAVTEDELRRLIPDLQVVRA
jgi:uncharacterized protein (DUF433 family)